MKYLFVKFECDYADEFDVSGCDVMTQVEYDKRMANAKSVLDKYVETWKTKMLNKWETMPESAYDKRNNKSFEEYIKWKHPEYEIGFGTNEQLQFSDYTEFARSFEVHEITEDTYNELHTLLPHGFFPFDYFDNADDDYEDDDE
jgi:hypothetical protein